MRSTLPGSPGDTRGPPVEPIRVQYDWSVTPPSAAVVETVAAAANAEPTDVAPLYSRVDPDALDAILERDAGKDEGGDARLSFPYGDWDVTVESRGTVTVTPRREVE